MYGNRPARTSAPAPTSTAASEPGPRRASPRASFANVSTAPRAPESAIAGDGDQADRVLPERQQRTERDGDEGDASRQGRGAPRRGRGGDSETTPHERRRVERAAEDGGRPGRLGEAADGARRDETADAGRRRGRESPCADPEHRTGRRPEHEHGGRVGEQRQQRRHALEEERDDRGAERERRGLDDGPRDGHDELARSRHVAPSRRAPGAQGGAPSRMPRRRPRSPSRRRRGRGGARRGGATALARAARRGSA